MGKHRDSKISPKIEKLLKDSVYHEEGVPGSARRCEKHMENLELAEHQLETAKADIKVILRVIKREIHDNKKALKKREREVVLCCQCDKEISKCCLCNDQKGHY